MLPKTMVAPLQHSEPETLLYYAYIGALATQFSAMEKVLTAAVRRLGAPELDYPFNKLIKALKRGLRSKFGVDVVEVKEAEFLIERIKQAGKRRNDIIHSAWTAFKDGQVMQQRVRPRDKMPLIAKYDKQQLTEIEALIHEVMDLRSEIPYWFEVFEERRMN